MQDPYEINEKIGRGINLGNALEAPNEGDWELTIKSDYFKIIKKAGFSSVRIPIRWSSHSSNNKPFTIDKSFLNRIDTVIKQALENDLIVIINVHHFDELFLRPRKYEEKFYSLWKQISQRFCNYSNTLLFEILNEPHYLLTSRKWNKIFPKILDVVRQKNPERIVLIGPAKWNNIEGLRRLVIPEEIKNIIFTFHYYKPLTFTHQGAEWIWLSNIFLGKKWNASQALQDKMNKHFQYIFNWGAKNNTPINLGEFGAYHKADLNSRILWTSEVVKAAEKFNFSWIYWEFGAGFGIFNTNTMKWNQQFLNQLIKSQ